MMISRPYKVSGNAKIFPVQNPWIYVGVPKTYTRLFKNLMDRGLVPIKIVIGKSVWNSSLLPKGDGTHFIALPAKIRKAEKIKLGSNIKLKFYLRER